jgi:hypothetical protein
LSETVSVAALALAALQVPLAARADAVSDWNAIGDDATFAAGRPGGAPLVDLAYVHAAIYDAVNAIDGGHTVFAVAPTTSPSGASPEAATAAAAYTVLSALLPTQQATLDAQYSAFLSGIPDGAAKTAGIAVGTEVAAAFLLERSGDGRNANVPYAFGSGPGVYQLTPGANPAVAPITRWLAQMRPFALESPSQFRADGPPDLSSAQWAEDYNETRKFGAQSGSLRTPQQTEIGLFYVENPGRQVNRWIRDLAAAQGLSLVDSARFFAQYYVSGADAVIACFDSKSYYNFWRPVTAILAGDTDGNDATEADPTWTPLATTPPHQEYPGAHSCVTGTLSFVLEDFFGTKKLDFSLTSRSVPGVALAVHSFKRTQDLRKEVIDARIYGGMHYRTSAVHGMVIANKVARWVSSHYFLPAD